MESTEASLLLLGICIVASAWLPPLLNRVPLSLSILFVAIGALASWLGVVTIPGDSLRSRDTPELLLEAVVIFALMSAGLKIDRPFGWTRWKTTWRLLGIGMPVTVLVLMGVAMLVCGLRASVAWLIAAILVPTDPVLASIVSVGPPGQTENGEIRFGLTSEAGFNDGLALPFVTLGLAWTHGQVPGAALLTWTFLGQTLGGAAVGLALGRVFCALLFRLPRGAISETGNGLVGAGLAVIAAGVAELLHVNAFIAVFSMALTLRAAQPDHEFQRSMAESADALGEFLTMLVLVAFGAWIASDLLNEAVASDWAFAAILLLVVRPAFAWLSLLGTPHPKLQRVLIAFFGIRGLSSLYYVAFAVHNAGFSEHGRVAIITGIVVLCSILLHGMAASPLMAWADRLNEART